MTLPANLRFPLPAELEIPPQIPVECEFSKELIAEWFEQIDCPSWMLFNLESSPTSVMEESGTRYTMRMKTKYRQLILPVGGGGATRRDAPPQTFGVSRIVLDSMVVSANLKNMRRDVFQELFRELSEGLTEMEDPRLFWDPEIRGPLPHCKLFDPHVPFDRHGRGDFQFPYGNDCPLCKQPIMGDGGVWGGKVLLWVHHECARKAFE